MILSRHPTAAADSYALALLIHSLFNPTALPPPTMEPPHPPPQPSSRGAIPPVVFPSFKKLLNPNPKPRMTAKLFLDVGMAESLGEGGGFFKDNRLLKICQGFEGLGLMSEGERVILLRYGFLLRLIFRVNIHVCSDAGRSRRSRQRSL